MRRSSRSVVPLVASAAYPDGLVPHRPAGSRRRHRHAIVAGVARRHAETIPAAGGREIHLPAGAHAGVVTGPVCAATARTRAPDAIVLAIAADHVILDADLFADACRAGRDAAAKGHIVTFGIRPTAPKTSYGYVRRGEALGFGGVSRVAAFVEKPDAATAATYVAQDYLWNSGNFLFRADALLAELARFEPAMAEAVEKAVAGAAGDLGFVRLDEQAFARAPQKSIDYAVMEKTARAAVVEGRFRWSDIGSWDAILEVAPRDHGGNSATGPVVSVAR